MGVIVAKTRNRFGKYHTWLFTGTVLNAFVLFALFAVPGNMVGDGISVRVYFAIIYILWGTTYTIMDIPYWSMIPAIGNTSKERENLTVIARSCAGVGSAIVSVITMISVAKLGGGSTPEHYRAGFKWLALIIAVIFVVAIFMTLLNVKENKDETSKPATIGQMFHALFTNDQAIAVVVAIVLVNTAFYITSNLMLYFFQFDIGGKDWEGTYALFTTFGGAIQIASMMLLYPLLRRFMKPLPIFKLSLISSIGGFVILLILAFLGLTSVFILFVPAFFIFGGYGLLTVLTTVFLSDTVIYGQLKNGRKDESVIFSMQTFVVKLASGVAALIAAVSIDLIGLDKEIAVQSTATITGLRSIMSITPAIVLLIALLFFFKKYKLTEKKMNEITAELEEKQAIQPTE